MEKILFLAVAFCAVFSGAESLTSDQDKVFRRAAQICTPESAGDSTIDDVPAISAALSECGAGGTIILPAGETYTIHSQLDFAGCQGCEIQINGKIVVANNTANGNSSWDLIPTVFHVRDVKGAVITSTNPDGGSILCASDVYWGKYIAPSLFNISGSSDVTFSNLVVKESPGPSFVTTESSSNINFSDLLISQGGQADYIQFIGHGLFISGTNIVISNVEIQTRGFCINFLSGSNYVTASDIVCRASTGDTYLSNKGVVIGEPSSYQYQSRTVQNIYISGVEASGSRQAAGILNGDDGNMPSLGTIRNVTWDNVSVSNSTWGALIETRCPCCCSCYCSHFPPSPVIQDITFKNFRGVTAGQYVNQSLVAGLFCMTGGCNVHFENWDVVPQNGQAPKVGCFNVTGDGFQCVDPYGTGSQVSRNRANELFSLI